MSEITSRLSQRLISLDQSLQRLSHQHGFDNAKSAIQEVINLLAIDGSDNWKLFNDDKGKIRSNSGWFMLAEGFADKRATYKIAENNSANFDLKAFWIQKTSKSVISWLVAITPNFEDEPFYQNKNVGIDFIIPPKADKIIIVLSRNYVIRTLELSGNLIPTQVDILQKWVQSFDFSNKEQTHQILWDSFDLEPVNKQFYKEISSFFVELKQYLVKSPLFDGTHAAYFTNRLIGRLVFCWFLNKKGIINPEINYFGIEGSDSSEFYHQKLETLFFKVFNTPENERENGVDIKTPFLNGGLFEPRKGDFFGNKDLTFPSDYFERLIKTLNHYNFTTDESTSTFQQVAIDPEMLGRIFENLLAEQVEETGEQARKAKGAFYTPREIVEYMCRESLREYLKSKITDDEMRDQRISDLLDKKPHQIQDKSGSNLRRDLKNYRDEIISALDEVKIIDPACGSGAFPMGMLQLLLQCYDRLEPRFDPYKTKLSVIKNNLFGVDIEPMAVEISRLRAWLSIIVDEESESKKVEPLPNLDFKFVCANSLIPLEKEGGLFDQEEMAQKMQEIRDEYFSTRSQNKKEALRKKFNKLYRNGNQRLFSSEKEKQLLSYHPFNSENISNFFDTKFMFGIDGFDIVIGNPPYLRVQGINKDFISKYKQIYQSATGRFDMYIIFSERAISLAKDGGIVNFIMPHKWTNASFGSGLRSFISSNMYLFKLISFGAYQVFNASTYTSLIWFKKSKNEEILYLLLNKDLSTNTELDTYLRTLDQKDFSEINVDTLGIRPWVLTNSTTENVLNNIKKQQLLVKDVFKGIFQGTVTTGDDIFYLKGEIKGDTFIGYSERLNTSVELEASIAKPLLMGDDINRYSSKLLNKVFVIYPHFLDQNRKTKPYEEDDLRANFPLTYAYLLNFKEELRLKKIKYKTNPKYWYALHRSREMDVFEQDKIITPYLAVGSSMTLDTNNYYTNAKCYSLIKKDTTTLSYKFYLAILNSKLLWFYLKNTGTMFRGGYFAFTSDYLDHFPLPNSEYTDAVKLIEQKVSQILTITSQSNYDTKDPAKEQIDLEKEIDFLVYNLYDLSTDDIELIEKCI